MVCEIQIVTATIATRGRDFVYQLPQKKKEEEWREGKLLSWATPLTPQIVKLISSSASRRTRLHHVPNSHLPLAFEIVEVNDLMQSLAHSQPTISKPL